MQPVSKSLQNIAVLEKAYPTHFVCGMRNEKVQQTLLTMRELTFHKAVEEAEMAERASKDVVEFHESVPEVHSLPQQAGSCYRCDGQHDPQNCRFLNEQCRYCKKRGHIARQRRDPAETAAACHGRAHPE